MNKIVIHCKTEKQARKLMKLYESWGWKWQTGQKPLTDISYGKGAKYYSFHNHFGVGSRYYINRAYTILTYKQLKHILKKLK